MRFGTARDIITPRAPMKLACTGVFDQNFAGIHDDVYVRCLVLDDGENKALLMSFDLLFHDRTLNTEVAAYAAARYGVNPAAVILSCTHAHTAPAVKGYNPEHHDDAYEEMLLDRAKACVDRAMCSLTEGTLEYGTFDADFNVSRRGMRDGKFVNAPNLDPTYPRNKECFVLCVRDREGNIRSILTNYACHPVNYPTPDHVSGEFPARLCQLLDTRYYGCTSLFFQSTGGDVRPRPTVDTEADKNNGWPWKKLSFAQVDAFAKEIADAVSGFAESGRSKRAEQLSIAADAFTVDLPMNGKTLQDFEAMKQQRRDAADNPEKVHAISIADGGYACLPNSLALHCQTIRLTDTLYIAAVGGEPCFGVQRAIKKAFGEKDLLFIGYTDACAYIVDDRILAEGGYEAECHLEYGLKGPFKPGVDARYTEHFEKSLARLQE